MALKTRREALHVGLGVLSLSAAAPLLPAYAQDDKAPQSAVQYQTTPKNGQQCDHCVNWTPPDSCKVVAGKIVPTGYCIAFAPKES